MSMYCSSSTRNSSPKVFSMDWAWDAVSSSTEGEQSHRVIPAPIWAGLLGMTRITEEWPRDSIRVDIRAPAIIDSTVWWSARASFMSGATS